MQATIDIVLDSLPAEQGLRSVNRSLELIGQTADRQRPALRRLADEIDRIERQARPAASALQNSFASAFERIARDGRLSFGRLADSLTGDFGRLLTSLSAMAAARPITVPVTSAPSLAIPGLVSGGLGGGGMSSILPALLPGLLSGGALPSLLTGVFGGLLQGVFGGLFSGKPSDHTASVQGLLSAGLRPTEDGGDAETRAARDSLSAMIESVLATVTRATGQRLPDDLYLDLATGKRDGYRYWLYETAEDLYGKPASARPEALASGRFDTPDALVGGLVEALTEAMTGAAVTLEALLARNFADDARRAAAGIPDALDAVIAQFRTLRGTAEDLAADGLLDLDAVLGDLKGVRDRDLAQALSGLDATVLQAVIDYYATVENNTPILQAAEAALAALGETAEGAALSLTAAQRGFIDGQIAAARDYLTEMERQAADWRRLSSALRQTRQGLLLDSELSPLSPGDRLTEARRQFEDIAARARIGDSAAIADLPESSRRLLEASRAYYASSSDYFRDFERVGAVLSATESLAQRQLGIAESQLGTLRQQLDALTALQGGRQAELQGFATLTAALQGISAALAALGGGTPGGPSGDNAGVVYQPGSYGADRPAGEVMAELGVTRATRDAILAGLGQSEAGGGAVRARIDSDPAFASAYRAAIRAAGGVPNFALGGWHAGGLRLVGETGPELEATGPSRLYTADETRRLLAPASGASASGDSAAAGEIAELRRQQAREAEQSRAELRALRTEMTDIRQNLSRVIASR